LGRYYPDVIQNGLAAHWKLDETGSGQRSDSSPNLYHLAASSSIPNAAGKIANAADMQGGLYLFLSPDQFMFGDTSFTVTGWVWFDVLTANKVVFSDSGGAHFSYLLNHDGTFLKFSVSTDGTTVAATATSAITLSTSAWFFFRCWHDADLNQIGIQVNAESEVTTSHSGGTFTTGSTHQFVLGKRLDASADIDGRVDSVTVWRRHLPAAYQTDLYNGGSGLDYPFPAISH
jgi:hypothetical protein